MKPVWEPVVQQVLCPDVADMGFSRGLGDWRWPRYLEDHIDVFKILNGYEHTDINISVSVKRDRKNTGHEGTLAKVQCRLYIKTFSFSTKNRK